MILLGTVNIPELLVEVVEHINHIPYFPSTLPNGFAYIIGLQGMKETQIMNIHGYVST